MENNVATIETNAKAAIGTGQHGEGDTVKEKPGHGDSPNGSGKKKPVQEYIDELKIYMETIPGPNEGRIEELRDLIRKGRLITKEALRESAQKIAQQFFGRSDF